MGRAPEGDCPGFEDIKRIPFRVKCIRAHHNPRIDAMQIGISSAMSPKTFDSGGLSPHIINTLPGQRHKIVNNAYSKLIHLCFTITLAIALGTARVCPNQANALVLDTTRNR